MAGRRQEPQETGLPDRGGLGVVDLMVRVGLADSRAAARRLVRQGGVRLGEQVVSDEMQQIVDGDFKDGAVVLRAGKKKLHRLVRGDP